MELNVLKQAGNKVPPDALVRSIKRADAILARPVATETYLEGATAYTATQFKDVAAANIALDIRLPANASAASILDELDNHFAQAGTFCHLYECSDVSWPTEIAQLLTQRGCQPIRRNVYQLVRYQPADESADVQVIPGRAAYGETQKLYHNHARLQGSDDAQAAQQAAAIIDQLDEARIDLFLARRLRVAAGAASLLTLGNVGVILDWFALAGDTQEQVLHTLMARMIDHCQRAQFEQVIVRVDEGDARSALYESMGFALAASYESYRPGAVAGSA